MAGPTHHHLQQPPQQQPPPQKFQYDAPTQGPGHEDDADGQPLSPQSHLHATSNHKHEHRQVRSGVRLVDQHRAGGGRVSNSRQTPGLDALPQSLVLANEQALVHLQAQEGLQKGLHTGQEARSASHDGNHDQQQPQQQQQLQLVGSSDAGPSGPAGVSKALVEGALQAPGGILQLLQQLHDQQGLWTGMTVCSAVTIMT